MTGTIEDTETIHTLTRLLANEIDTSTAMAEELLDAEAALAETAEYARVAEEQYTELSKDLVETIKTLDKTRAEHGHQLDVIKGFVQTGDFLALAEYLQVDVPIPSGRGIPGGKRVQVGDWLETLRDYEDAPVGTKVLWVDEPELGPRITRVKGGWDFGANVCPSSWMANDRRKVVEVPA